MLRGMRWGKPVCYIEKTDIGRRAVWFQVPVGLSWTKAPVLQWIYYGWTPCTCMRSWSSACLYTVHCWIGPLDLKKSKTVPGLAALAWPGRWGVGVGSGTLVRKVGPHSSRKGGPGQGLASPSQGFTHCSYLGFPDTAGMAAPVQLPPLLPSSLSPRRQACLHLIFLEGYNMVIYLCCESKHGLKLLRL